MITTKMTVKLKFIRPMLATAPNDKEIYERFIASKAETPEKARDELNGLTAEEAVDHASTVFFRDKDGVPMISSHLIKGNIKENMRTLIDLGDCPISPWQNKRVVNTCVQMNEPFIRLNVVGEITNYQRPLRAETMRGDRVALAMSEMAEAGTSCEFTMTVFEPVKLAASKTAKDSERLPLSVYVVNALKHGQWNGLGCLRSAGFGRYTVEIKSEPQQTT